MTRYAISLAIWPLLCAVGVSVAQAQPPISACVQVAAPQFACTQTGRHVAFVCTNETGTATYAAGLSCLHNTCSPSAFAAAVMRVTTSADWKKAADAEWSANVKWTCDAPPDDQTKALCAERKDWVSSNWAAWTKDFKPAVWRVKPSGKYPTRPAYLLTGTTLGTKEVARAPVNANCNVAKPTKASGSDLWAEFDPARPGVVALCDKATQ